MGAMSFGSFPDERIVLNHDAIWSQPKRVGTAAGLSHERHGAGLCAGPEGRLRRRARRVLPGQEQGQLGRHLPDARRSWKSPIWMHGERPGRDSAPARPDDRRVRGVAAKLADGEVRETLLASYPDQCIAVRLETTRPGGLHCRFKLNRPTAWIRAVPRRGIELGFEGDCGTKFAASARCCPRRAAG